MGERDLFYSEHLSFRLNFDRPDGSILRLDFDGTSLAREDWTLTLTADRRAVRLSRAELVHMARVFPMLAALNRPHADIVGAVHLDLLHIEEDDAENDQVVELDQVVDDAENDQVVELDQVVEPVVEHIEDAELVAADDAAARSKEDA
jgi:hypothetical protein